MPNQRGPDYIAWNETYSVGQALLDRHHQALLSLINELYHQTQHQSTGLTSEGLANRLYEYTRDHFTAEEELLARGEYPDLAEHRKLHAAMSVKTLKITSEFRGYSRDEALEVLQFLKSWWQNHILKTDLKYVPWLPPVQPAEAPKQS